MKPISEEKHTLHKQECTVKSFTSLTRDRRTQIVTEFEEKIYKYEESKRYCYQYQRLQVNGWLAVTKLQILKISTL